ncbi:MAG: hypothetical protein OXT65_00315 [Alphaproteobacteria bacterium]|nr:hypothetical protein [Alphaproteobacteria bacterium]
MSRESISIAHASWKAQNAKLIAQRDVLREKIAAQGDVLDVLKEQNDPTKKSWFAHTFFHATEVWPAQRRRDKLQRKLDRKNNQIEDFADSALLSLADVAFFVVPGGNKLKEKQGDIRDLRKQVGITRSKCESAMHGEMMSMAGGPAMSLLSHTDTRGAANSLKYIGEKVSALGAMVEGVYLDHGGLNKSNNLDLILDVLSGFGPSFMSVKNAGQLEAAMSGLDTLDQRLMDLHRQLGSDQKVIVSDAVQKAQGHIPELDVFVRDLSGFVSSDMRAPRQESAPPAPAAR